MANVPYDGVPDVAPRGDAPIPFQRDNSNVIAGAFDKVETGLKTVGAYYDQTVTDDAFNQFETFGTTTMRGDPSRAAPGPDGTMQPNTGYLGTNGRAAMDAELPTWKAIEAEEKRIASTLKSPTALAAFQQRAARYKNDLRTQIGSHAASQTDVWSTNVSNASAQLALDRIAANPNDPVALAGAATDLRNARTKAAMAAGAQKGDAVFKSALAQADREFVAAHIGAIGTTDPKRAMEMAEKNKAILGEAYDEVYDRYRTRAAEAVGVEAATTAYDEANVTAATINSQHIANPAQPIYQQTVSAVPGGYSAAGLARLVQIESAGNPNAVSPSGKHVGLGQFSESTAREVGLTDRNDPKQSIIASQRYGANNAAYLKKFLGRQPTDAELYLAHQQGPGGAQKLLMNPDAPAASLIGSKAVIQNGGKQDMTAAEFVAMWANRFNKTTPANAPMSGAPQVSRSPWAQRGMAPGDSAAPAQADLSAPAPLEAPEPVDPEMLPRLGEEYSPADAKADAYDRIFNDPDLNTDEQQAAITALNQRFAVDKIRADEAARVKKDAADKAVSDYTTRILTGNTEGIADQIAMDPNIEPATKMALINAMQADADRTVAGAIAAYGTGYSKVLNQVLAEPGDPSRITDNVDILRMAADPAGGLTMQGAQKLLGIMVQAQKNPDVAAASTSYNSMIRYAKGKLSFQREPSFPGDPGTPDPMGEELFNARFIPKFDAAYNAWIEAKKNPWEFLTQENVDKLMQGLRNPREMAMQELLAQNGGVDAALLEAPPPPEGVTDMDAWKLVVNSAPQIGDKPPNPVKWNAALNALVERPTPERMTQFDAFFGSTGVTASDILTALGVVSRETTEADTEQDSLRFKPEGGAPKPNVQWPFGGEPAPSGSW